VSGLALDVRPITKDEARGIVLPNHYSGTWNTTFGIHNFGIFDEDDALCGAAVFGHLMNPASASSIADLPAGAIVELNRLWIDDKFGANTETAMLSRCFKWLKANTEVQLIQSFADGRLGVGTIYKAANFGYYGRSRTRFYRHRETGETFHQALMNNGAKLSTMITLNAWWTAGLLETFETYTYRYLYPLSRYARRVIKPTAEPYPAYERGEIAGPYQHSLALVARCQVACEAQGDPRALKFMDYLRTHAAPDEVFQLLADAADNEWIAAVIEREQQRPRLFDLIDMDGGAA
jgi:hypothetical protein